MCCPDYLPIIACSNTCSLCENKCGGLEICCNFYLDDFCVEECPENYVVDDDCNCVESMYTKYHTPTTRGKLLEIYWQA